MSQVPIRSVEKKTSYVDVVSFRASPKLSAGKCHQFSEEVKRLLTKRSTFEVEYILTDGLAIVFFSQFGNEIASVPIDIWGLVMLKRYLNNNDASWFSFKM